MMVAVSLSNDAYLWRVMVNPANQRYEVDLWPFGVPGATVWDKLEYLIGPD